MNVQKKDGTRSEVRVADLQQISFLTVDEGGQGLIVKTLDGKTTAVLFEMNPVVTIADGRLLVKSSSADAVEFEITDIAEIRFGEAGDASAISELKGFDCILQDGSVLLRGIPKGVKPRVYSLDGRRLRSPLVRAGELRLSRATLGHGIFIVKVGTFSTKIKL